MRRGCCCIKTRKTDARKEREVVLSCKERDARVENKEGAENCENQTKVQRNEDEDALLFRL